MARSSMRRRGAAGLALAAAVLIGAGCGSSDEEDAPTACLATGDAYRQALRTAPGAVRLEGEVPISDCLTPSQGTGELENIGQEMIVTATKLNAEARRDPAGQAAVELGYLIGAVSKGADSAHTDLVRRLNASAQFSETGETLPPEFQQAFGRGYAAGLRSG
jgi:hypothetical protein